MDIQLSPILAEEMLEEEVGAPTTRLTNRSLVLVAANDKTLVIIFDGNLLPNSL